MSRAREHLRSNIVGYITLFLVLAGGAYALPGKNTVDSGDIRNSQVRTADIRNSDVRGADIRAGAVNGTDVGDSSLTGSDLAENSLTGADVADLTGADVTDDSLTDADIDTPTLTDINADTLSDRTVCDANRHLTVDNSSNIQDEQTVCIIGPFELKVTCEADLGGSALIADIDVETSANGTAVARDSSPVSVDAGQRRTLVALTDLTANDSALVSASTPFSVWTNGGTLLVGQAAIRVDSRSDDSRVCDFTIFGTG